MTRLSGPSLTARAPAPGIVVLVHHTRSTSAVHHATPRARPVRVDGAATTPTPGAAGRRATPGHRRGTTAPATVA
jgi:hypothetical protein